MKVLITLDGSKFAEAVLGPAANLAGTSNAEVHLIKVVKPSEAKTTWAKTGVGEPHSPGEMGMTGALGGLSPREPAVSPRKPRFRPKRGCAERQRNTWMTLLAASFPEGQR